VYTQCPDCLTRFRVTAEALRAARGTVRCGRCHGAFDALSRLGDTPDTIPSPIVKAAGLVTTDSYPARSAPTAAEYHFSADDIEKVFVEARDWHQQFGGTEVPADVTEPSTVSGEDTGVVVEPAERIEDITMEGDRISTARWTAFESTGTPEPQEPDIDLDTTSRLEVLRDMPEAVLFDDEPMTLNSIEPAMPTPPRLVAAPPPVEPAPMAVDSAPTSVEPTTMPEETVAAPEPVVEPTQAAESTVEPEPLPEMHATPAGDLRPWRRSDSFEGAALETGSSLDDETGGTRWSALGWTAASLLLAILLFAQVAHHFRQDLVRHPMLGQPLQQVYDALDMPLSPNWDPSAFEIRQWGTASESSQAGQLDVRASLRNRANFAQPYPLLRLALEDRYGESVAVRDFRPADYLKDPARATRMLAPGEQSEAELLIVDPGPDAVGYRLDVCLPGRDDRLRCAQDQG
jgi:predicted Zn finger-like uncharacterized protein